MIPNLKLTCDRIWSVLLAFVILLTFSAINKVDAQKGKDGSPTFGSGSLNTYAAVTAIAGSSITVSDIGTLTGPTPIPFATAALTAGDCVMVYQAQGAGITIPSSPSNPTFNDNITYQSAGKYEFVAVASISGNTITTKTALVNTYQINGKVQVVRVPRYKDLTITGTVKPLPWNRAKGYGGIVAIEATGTITVSGKIDASALGFKGGTALRLHPSDTILAAPKLYFVKDSTKASAKGESIVGDSLEYVSFYGGAFGIGAIANGGGGGGNHNASGGGGSNAGNPNNYGDGKGIAMGTGVMCTTCIGGLNGAWKKDSAYIANGNFPTTFSGGGRGGYTFVDGIDYDPWNRTPGVGFTYNRDKGRMNGGMGGRPLIIDPKNTIFFGGGGGAGDGNADGGYGLGNNSTNGGNGGGIIFLKACTINGFGKILSNGGSTPSVPADIYKGDGQGGGGGGGTIILDASTIQSLSSIQAFGGNGTDQLMRYTDRADTYDYSTTPPTVLTRKNLTPTDIDGWPEVEGPGGGGGGGYIYAFATPPAVTSVVGGLAGITNAYPVNGGGSKSVGGTKVPDDLFNGSTHKFEQFGATDGGVGTFVVKKDTIKTLGATICGTATVKLKAWKESSTTTTITTATTTGFTKVPSSLEWYTAAVGGSLVSSAIPSSSTSVSSDTSIVTIPNVSISADTAFYVQDLTYPCSPRIKVKITKTSGANSGTPATTMPSACADNATNINLTTYLTGTRDPGGVWDTTFVSSTDKKPKIGSFVTTSSSVATFNPSGNAAGTYNFKYKVGTAPCAAFSIVTVTVNPAPSISVTPLTVCSATLIKLDTIAINDTNKVTVAGTTKYYSAYPTNVNELTGSNLTVSPTAKTTYYAVRTATTGGCTDTTTITVNVKYKPRIDSVLVVDPTCTLSTGFYKIYVEDSASTSFKYDIDFLSPVGYDSLIKASTIITNAGLLTLTKLPSGTNITNTTVRVNGCVSNTFNITQSLKSVPTMTLKADKVTICADGASSLKLNASPKLGTWTIKDVTTFAANTHGAIGFSTTDTTYNVGLGSGAIRLIYAANGCKDSINVTIDTLPNFTVVTTQPKVCTDKGKVVITFNSPYAPYGKYDLNLNGDASYDSLNVPFASTTKTITYSNLADKAVIRNVNVKSVLTGCSNTYTINDTIKYLPGVKIATASSPICADGVSSLNLSASPKSGAWTIKDSTTFAANTHGSIVTTPDTAYNVGNGSGIIKLIYAANGCKDSINVTVNALPNITVVTTQPKVCTDKGKVVITFNSPYVPSGTYDLNLNGDASYDSLNVPFASATKTITYSNLADKAVIRNVSVRSVSTGCSNTYTINDTIKYLPGVKIATASSAICADGVSSLNLSASPKSGAWTIKDSTTFAANTHGSIVTTPDTAYNVGKGSGIIKLIYAANGCKDSINVKVNALPSFTATVRQPVSCKDSGQVVLKFKNPISGKYYVDLNNDKTYDYDSTSKDMKIYDVAAPSLDSIVIRGLKIGTVISTIRVKSHVTQCDTLITISPSVTIAAPGTPQLTITKDSLCADGASSINVVTSIAGGTWSLGGTAPLGTLTNVNASTETYKVGFKGGADTVKYVALSGCGTYVIVRVFPLPSYTAKVVQPVTCLDSGSVIIKFNGTPKGDYAVDLDGNGTFEYDKTKITVTGDSIVIGKLASGTVISKIGVFSYLTGCDSAITLTPSVTLTKKIAPKITTVPATVCADGASTIALTTSTPTGAWSLSTYKANLATDATVNNVSAQFTSGKIAGTAHVLYTLNGCKDSVAITVDSLPLFTVTKTDAQTCLGKGTVAIDIKTAKTGDKYDIDVDGDALYDSTNMSLTSAKQILMKFGIGQSILNIKIRKVGGCVSNVFTIKDTISSPNAPDNSTSTADLCAENQRELLSTNSGGTWSLDPSTGSGNAGSIITGANNKFFFKANAVGVVDTVIVLYTLNNCAKPKKIIINPNPPQPTVTNDTLCKNNASSPLTAGPVGATLKWYDAQGASIANAPTPSTTSVGTTKYFVSQVLKGCEGPKIDMLVEIQEATVSAGPDLIVFFGDSVQINATDNSGTQVYTYSWSPVTALSASNVLKPKTSPEKTLIYTLTVTSPIGCKASDDVQITVRKKIWIPSAFSPNGDGLNEKWIIDGIETYPDATVDVFNRWGNVVFKSTGYDDARAWDGNVGGTTVPHATYYYIVDPKDGTPVFKGNVTIVR